MTSLCTNGTSGWYEPTMEWLLVFVVTEMGIAPQNMASGRSALSVLSVLQNTIVDLVGFQRGSK